MALLFKTLAAAFALAALPQQAAATANAGRAASSAECFQEYAAAFAAAGDDKCGAVIGLAKCAASTKDAATQSTLDQIASSYKCDLSAHTLAPVVSQEDNSLHMAVDDAHDVVFQRKGRAADTGASVWDLKDRVEDLAADKMSAGEVEAQLKKVGDTVEQTLSLMEKSVKASAAALTEEIKKQQGGLTGDVDKNMETIRKQMAALKTRLKATLGTKIKELNDKTKAAVDKMGTNIKAVEDNSGDCNYATHYKKSGKCVLLTDCNAGDKTVRYDAGVSPGFRKYPSYIVVPATKTADRVCATASYDYFHHLSDHVRMHWVRWPAWQYPLYSEWALTAVCKQVGMKPWRDQNAWQCNTNQFMCDTWGYNLGGHDLMSKIQCGLGAGRCYGHSGSRQGNYNDWGQHLFKMGFAKGQKDIRIVTKMYHSSTYDTRACTQTVRLDNSRMHHVSGYSCSVRPTESQMKNAVAVCAWGPN